MIKIGNTWVKKSQESKRIMSMTHTLKMSHHGHTTIFERHTKRGVRGEDLLTEGLITNSSTPGNKSLRPMKYIKFYFDEWALSTRLLSTEEKGAWVELIAALGTSEAPGEMSVNKRSLARLFGFRAVKTEGILNALAQANLITYTTIGDNFVLKSEPITNKSVQQKRLEKAGKFAVSVRESTKINKNRSEKPDRNAIPKDKRLKTKEKKKDKKKGPPTLDEIKTFCASRSISEEVAETFFNYYEGRNLWTNKNGQLVNWWIMIQNDPWKNNGNNRNNNNGSPRRIDRNQGTTNEGRASQYEGVGRVARD